MLMEGRSFLPSHLAGEAAQLRAALCLLLICWAACQCAPGCQHGSSNLNIAARSDAATVWGACYSISSNTTWASATGLVLDLCNQVQGIWLLQGEVGDRLPFRYICAYTE